MFGLIYHANCYHWLLAGALEPKERAVSIYWHQRATLYIHSIKWTLQTDTAHMHSVGLGAKLPLLAITTLNLVKSIAKWTFMTLVQRNVLIRDFYQTRPSEWSANGYFGQFQDLLDAKAIASKWCATAPTGVRLSIVKHLQPFAAARMLFVKWSFRLGASFAMFLNLNGTSR